jgi:hypothetical protein
MLVFLIKKIKNKNQKVFYFIYSLFVINEYLIYILIDDSDEECHQDKHARMTEPETND